MRSSATTLHRIRQLKSHRQGLDPVLYSDINRIHNLPRSTVEYIYRPMVASADDAAAAVMESDIPAPKLLGGNMKRLDAAVLSQLVKCDALRHIIEHYRIITNA